MHGPIYPGCRELTLQNEYLRQENKVLQAKMNKRIVFTDDERRSLVESAVAMGQDWQTWSAAMYLYADKCVETDKTPFFEEARSAV